MQYDDGANRATDPDMDETDRAISQSDQQQAWGPKRPVGSDNGGEALAEYSVVEESMVEQPDEQADAADARGGIDDVWQGAQPVQGSEAVSEDPVTEDLAEDMHPTNVQPVTPDLGGPKPVDPDLGTGGVDPDLGTDESVDDSSGTGTTTADSDADRTNAVAAGPGVDTTDESTAAAGTSDPVARTDNGDPLRARWHVAQHLFVDDPTGAVHKAAALVQEAAERATSTTRAESGTDHGTEASPDTERLRLTMQHYHEAFDLLIGISSGDPA